METAVVAETVSDLTKGLRHVCLGIVSIMYSANI